MTRHSAHDPAHDDPGEVDQLIVPATAHCRSRSVLSPTGYPRLSIDYGGAALVFDVVDLREAETFGLGLVRTALAFASHCRYLDDHRPACHDPEYR
jgi:hypothetical protein